MGRNILLVLRIRLWQVNHNDRVIFQTLEISHSGESHGAWRKVAGKWQLQVLGPPKRQPQADVGPAEKMGIAGQEIVDHAFPARASEPGRGHGKGGLQEGLDRLL